MKKNTIEYRIWKKRQNYKNLKKRSKAKKKKRINKSKFASKKKFFIAPSIFSFINNFEETSSFFDSILSFFDDKTSVVNRIFIDISNVTYLSIDALMYLLFVFNSLKVNIRKRFRIIGNLPKNETMRKKFEESGFYNYVRRIGNDFLQYSGDNIQIMAGDSVDNNLAKETSLFLQKKTKENFISFRSTYTMLIELMSNTAKHAYIESDNFLNRWYYYVSCESENKFCFTFMDIGSGIPSTVKKNFFEKAKDKIGFDDDADYIESALLGEFRTSTNLQNRGKGLPGIMDRSIKGEIENLLIISNNGYLKINKKEIEKVKINNSLKGTLYYWEINI